MKANLERKFIAASIAALSISPAFTPAFAQDTGAQGRTTGFEEVIVTARRQEESAQSIPISMTALSADALTQHTISSLEDLTRVTPGLRFSAEGGGQNTTISIRGLSKIPVGEGAPAVVTYFSDVPLANDGTNLPTFDLANIQVLKGPQGTLFGRNTIGGAVLVSPQEPTFETQGYIKGGLGDYSAKSLEGAFNLPLVDDKLALRVAGQVRRRDGSQQNLGPGPDFDDVHQHSLRAALLWNATEKLSNTLMWDYFLGNETPPNTTVVDYKPGQLSAMSPLFAPFEADLAKQFADAQARGVRKTFTDTDTLTLKRQLSGITDKINYEIADKLTFRNIFGYRTTKVGTNNAVDGLSVLQADATALPLAVLGGPFAAVPPQVTIDRLRLLEAGQTVDKKQITDEVQLIGTALNDRMDWIVGGFYLKDEPNGAQGSWFNQFQLGASGIGFAVPAQTGTAHTTTTSKSVFGQMGLDLSDWVLDGLKFNYGYRFTRDEVQSCGYNSAGGTSVQNADFLTQSECKALSPELTLKGSAPTWTVGLDYQVTGNTLTYITSRRGYRSGGINSPVFNTPGTAVLQPYQYVKPEHVDDVEIGVKSDFKVGGVPTRVNLAAYKMKYSDAVQFINVLGVISPQDPAFPNRGSFGLNAGDLTIKGVELELTVAPVDGLILNASGAYTDQNLDKIGNIPPGFSYTAADVTLPTPQTSATFGFRYTFPWQALEGDIAFSGDYFWTDKWQAQTVELPSYDVTNFRLDWTGIMKDFDAGLFVTNAFDKEYITAPIALVPSLPIGTAMYGQPRMFGLEATYHFGKR